MLVPDGVSGRQPGGDLSGGADVYSDGTLTNRFVVPVPSAADGGELAVEPDKGRPILNKTGVQKRGLVFRNFTDRVWQVAKQDGNGVVLVNEVAQEDGESILDIRKLIVVRLGDTAEAVRELVGKLADMGYGDQFNSSLPEIAGTLRKHKGTTYGDDGAGLYVREGKAVDAVRIVGAGRFQCPVVHAFEGDAVLVRHGTGEVNLCQSDVFERTYLLEDGSPAQVEDLPVGLFSDNAGFGLPSNP